MTERPSAADVGHQAPRTKQDILQGLLDTQALCLELFDAVDEDRLSIDRVLIGRLGGLVKALHALHQQMFLQYAMSGRAGDDMLADIRKGLK